MMEEIEISGTGFNPLKDYGAWRVAQLSYDEEVNALQSLQSLGRHFETQEVFTLLSGGAVMITAGTGAAPDDFEATELSPGKLYVVQEGQWHAAVLTPESRLLIIENRNTGAANSENHSLSVDEKVRISSLVI
jgi:mannose-6-phosphate isomerase-like protein (cupin superfamily)